MRRDRRDVHILVAVLVCVGFGLLGSACVTSTSDTPTVSPAPTHMPTATPTRAPTETPSPTPSPTPRPSPTARPTSTPTPAPGIALKITDAESGAELAGVLAVLLGVDGGEVARGETSGAGILGLPVASGIVTVQLSLEGYWDRVEVLEAVAPPAPADFALERGLYAELTAASGNLRMGPDAAFAVVVTAQAGDRFKLLGRNPDGTWLAAVYDDATVWLLANLASVTGAVEGLSVVTPPPLPTPLPTPTPGNETPIPPTPVPPTQSPAPVAGGTNLLPNGGFEEGAAYWTPRAMEASGLDVPLAIVDSAGEPLSVRSGSFAGRLMGPDFLVFNEISTAIPGATYRLGAWVRLWSSSGVNREISENPAPISAYICLSKLGSYIVESPYGVCSSSSVVLDQWVYLTTEITAETTVLSAVLRLANIDYSRRVMWRGDASWDDVTLVQIAGPTP